MRGNPFVLVALFALLLVGAWGWGWAAVRLLRRAGWDTVGEVLGPALQILLGMALFLSAGGFLVALDLARFGVLLGWHVLGVVFLLPRLPALVRRAASVRPLAWLGAATLGIVAFVLLVVAMGQAIGIQIYNPYDDDAAYVYLAKRLLGTGGLVDPFNLRRITSYGGSALYQSMFLQTAGNASLRGFELVFALGVLLIVVVGTTRRRWLIPGTFVLGIALILGHGVGPIVNLSPEFSVAALSLGVYKLLGRVPLEYEREQPFLYVVIGVLLAGILSLRFYFLISVVVAVLFVLLALRGRRSIRCIAIIAASGVIAVAGWAVALLRSSGTPIFPFVPGNYNTSWPSGSDPTLHGIGNFIRRFFDAFNGYDIGWVCIMAILIALVFLLVSRREPARMIVLLGAGLGCLVQIVVISNAFSGSAPVDVIRFVAPSTLACGLLAVAALWPMRTSWEAHEIDGEMEDGATPSAVPRLKARLRTRMERVLAATPTRTVFALGVAAVMSNPLLGYGRAIDQKWSLGRNVFNGNIIMGDRYAQFEGEYRVLNSMVPKGAKVLAAVDRPSLLDYSTYTFATLDSAGAVSPAPHMPYFRGADAKVAYLRHLGYAFIAADSPSEIGLYQFHFLLHQLHSPVYFSREQAAYNIDWQGSVTSLENSGRYEVRRSQELSLIRIG